MRWPPDAHGLPTRSDLVRNPIPATEYQGQGTRPARVGKSIRLLGPFANALLRQNPACHMDNDRVSNRPAFGLKYLPYGPAVPRIRRQSINRFGRHNHQPTSCQGLSGTLNCRRKQPR